MMCDARDQAFPEPAADPKNPKKFKNPSFFA
jgi:hypothetical protein